MAIFTGTVRVGRAGAVRLVAELLEVEAVVSGQASASTVEIPEAERRALVEELAAMLGIELDQ